MLFAACHGIISVLYDGRANARKLPRWKCGGGDSVTNVELFALLIAVASLALTIYFGMKR